MPVNPDIIHLISLLDDEDENIAIDAMAELLFREDELGELPALLQESDNLLVRRRIHQLEAALTLRRRRREFLDKLAAQRVDFIDALIDVHLQWFDNDSRPDLERQFADFSAEIHKRDTATLEDISYVMRKYEMLAEKESTLRPENYCLGSILNDKTGSGAVLCGVCRALAADAGKMRIVRTVGDFAISDGVRLLVPCHNWQICGAPPLHEMEFFEERALLRYASTMLFSCAVNSDSFRYVLTIMQSLTGAADDAPLDNLPYPYHADDIDKFSSGRQQKGN